MMKRLAALMVLAVLLCGVAYADTSAHGECLEAYHELVTIYNKYQANSFAYDHQLFLVHSYLIVFFSCEMLSESEYNVKFNEYDFSDVRVFGTSKLLKELCENWIAYYNGSMSLSAYKKFLFGHVQNIVNNW